MYQGIPARLIHVVGTLAYSVICWPAQPGECAAGKTCHRAFKEITRSDDPNADNLTEAFWRDKPADQMPTHCQYCGKDVPESQHSKVGTGHKRIYNTASGDPEPGDLYFADWYSCDGRGKCIYGWTNCDGKHLMAICPNGHHWDIDSRASNCTMPNDHTHRCWVRHGEAPNIHVDKNGYTCAAGAGSIIAGDYHGFLHNGQFTNG